MEYLIYALIVLAFYYYFITQIVAPYLRLRLRFRLFALRDEVRGYWIDRAPGVDERVYEHLEGSLNNAIHLLTRINIEMLRLAYQEFQARPDLRNRVSARIEMIEKCPNPRFMEIRAEVSEVLFDAYVVNSAGWLIYLVPIAVAVRAASGMRDIVQNLVSLPERDVDKLFTRNALSPV